MAETGYKDFEIRQNPSNLGWQQPIIARNGKAIKLNPGVLMVDALQAPHRDFMAVFGTPVFTKEGVNQRISDKFSTKKGKKAKIPKQKLVEGGESSIMIGKNE